MRNIFPKKKSVFVFLLVAVSFVAGALFTAVVASKMDQRVASFNETVERSFRVADSGMKEILQGVYDGEAADLAALAAAHSGSCADGRIAGNAVSGAYEVALRDADGNRIACDDPSWQDKVVSIDSEGLTDATGRFIETAEAQAIGNKNCRQVGPIGSSSWSCSTNEYVQRIMANGTMATQMYVMCCQF